VAHQTKPLRWGRFEIFRLKKQ